MSIIAVIGAGYVGLVTGACLADMGNQVTCIDIATEKIERLKNGILPIYEPGLEEVVERNLHAGRLHFTAAYNGALQNCEFIFIAVNTPMDDSQGGCANMSYVESAACNIAQELDHDAIVINKSTVPVGSGDLVSCVLRTHLKNPAVRFSVVSNPEFLREGTAVQDFLHPDRIVLGSNKPEEANAVARLYLSMRAPIIITDLHTAEMTKYASNAFLATKISFINEIAQICEHLGADVKEVAAGMGFDKRIGRAFLDAGLGYGGSCLPKDVRALAYMAREAGLHPQLLHTVMDINYDQRRQIVNKLTDILGPLHNHTIGILGLAFKPNTDDMRDAPAIDIIRWITTQGATVRVYDPIATKTGYQALQHAGIDMASVIFCKTPYEAALDADALVLVTEWNEFKSLNMPQLSSAMHHPILVDGRNIYEAADMNRYGFIYHGTGRGTNPTISTLPGKEERQHPEVSPLALARQLLLDLAAS